MDKIIISMPEAKPIPMGAHALRHAGTIRSKKDKASSRQSLKRRLAREGW